MEKYAKEGNQANAAGPWTFPFWSTEKGFMVPQWGQVAVLVEPSFLPTLTVNFFPHLLLLRQVIFTSAGLQFEPLVPLFFDTPHLLKRTLFGPQKNRS